jgi:hypothetical protein
MSWLNCPGVAKTLTQGIRGVFPLILVDFWMHYKIKSVTTLTNQAVKNTNNIHSLFPTKRSNQSLTTPLTQYVTVEGGQHPSLKLGKRA